MGYLQLPDHPVLSALVLLLALVIVLSPEARQQAAEAVEDLEPTQTAHLPTCSKLTSFVPRRKLLRKLCSD